MCPYTTILVLSTKVYTTTHHMDHFGRKCQRNTVLNNFKISREQLRPCCYFLYALCQFKALSAWPDTLYNLLRVKSYWQA